MTVDAERIRLRRKRRKGSISSKEDRLPAVESIILCNLSGIHLLEPSALSFTFTQLESCHLNIFTKVKYSAMRDPTLG
jgi:hypothetical protein